MAIPYKELSYEADNKAVTADKLKDGIKVCSRRDEGTKDSMDEKNAKGADSSVVNLATVLVLKTFYDLAVTTKEENATESEDGDFLHTDFTFENDSTLPKKIHSFLSSSCSNGINSIGKLGTSSSEILQNILCNMDYMPSQPTSINVYPIFGLREYYQELEKNPQLPIQQRMKCDLVRCSTFSSYPSTEVSSMSLSKAGFYYEGNEDEVQCFECGLKHENWKKGDDAFDIHLRMSPECSFIKNLAKEMQTTSAQSIHSPQPSTSQQNGDTFTRNRVGFSTAPSPSEQNQELQSANINDSTSSAQRPHLSTQHANAIGGSSNTSTVSGNSSQTTRLSNSHASQSLSQLTSQTSVSRPPPKKTATETLEPLGISIEKPKYPQYAVMAVRLSSFRHWPKHKKQCPETLAKAGFIYEGTEDFTRCFFCGGGLREWEDQDDPWIEHARWYPKCVYIRQCKGDQFVQDVKEEKPQVSDDRCPDQKPVQKNICKEEILDLPAVQSVIEMGYNKDIVLGAVKVKIKEKDTKNINAETLLQMVWDIEDGKLIYETAEDKEIIEGATGVSSLEPKNNGSKDDIEALVEENRHLKDQQICKICMDEPISIVFLPCGHMATCGNCAPAMRKCPLCRKFIKGTVKAILS